MAICRVEKKAAGKKQLSFLWIELIININQKKWIKVRTLKKFFFSNLGQKN